MTSPIQCTEIGHHPGLPGLQDVLHTTSKTYGDIENREDDRSDTKQEGSLPPQQVQGGKFFPSAYV